MVGYSRGACQNTIKKESGQGFMVLDGIVSGYISAWAPGFATVKLLSGCDVWRFCPWMSEQAWLPLSLINPTS